MNLPAAHTVRDRISFGSSLELLKVPSFRILDALQDHPADVQLNALALTLALLCRGVELDVHELVTRANRQIVDADRVRNPALEAIEAYATGELR